MNHGTSAAGFVPPPYPYDRLDSLVPIASAHDGGVVDLSIGTPCDPPPQSVLDALATSGSERSYPPSIGSVALREAAQRWMRAAIRRRHPGGRHRGDGRHQGVRRHAAAVDELADAGARHGAVPGGVVPVVRDGRRACRCRAVPVPSRPDGRLDLAAISPDDASRALLLWVNSPSNPTGDLDDLDAAADWGRTHGVPVFSDECYVEFTWSGRGRTILERGTDWRGGGPLVVEALEPRRAAGGFLRRRPGTRPLPAGDPQARRA